MDTTRHAGRQPTRQQRPPTRVVAVDWSGRLDGRTSWLGAADATGLFALSGGWTAPRLRAWLLAERERDPRLAVGLDFAFSLPAWWLARHRLARAPDLWALAARDGERWLREGEWPFWGRPWRWRRPDLDSLAHLRATDAQQRASSPFKLVGPDSVGTGSIRGMALLHDLAGAGFAVWPFTAPGWPRVFEIFPRQVTRGLRRPPRLGEDAFDAAVCALAMWRERKELARWPAGDPVEGSILSLRTSGDLKR
jgi:hypothetical protein